VYCFAVVSGPPCTVAEAQHLLDCFVTATRRFDLSVSIKKSKVMFQPQMSSCYLPPVATINNIQLPLAETFCYLGSRVTYRNTLDDELTARVAKARAALGQLSKRLWSDHAVVRYIWRPRSKYIVQLSYLPCCMAVKTGHHTGVI